MLTTSRHSLHELFGGRGEQWHNINIHPQQLTETEALSLCPWNSKKNTLFVISAGVETSCLVFSFSCSVIQGCFFQFLHQLLSCTREIIIPTGASFGYRNSWWGGGKVSALATAEHTDIQSLCIPQLSFQFWGILEDWTASGLQRFLLFWTERQIWICMKEARG